MKDDIVKLTEYDKLSYDSNTQMMKAMLPYVPAAIQPGFAYAIIFKEFANLRHSIANDSDAELGICSVPRGNTSVSEILKDLRQYASEKQQNFIDMIMNMMQTVSIYQQYMQLITPGASPLNDNFDRNVDKIMQQLANGQN